MADAPALAQAMDGTFTFVLVEVNGGHISVLELGRSSDGLALVEGWRFTRVGYVREMPSMGPAPAWRWKELGTGETGQEQSKAQATTAMLAAGGYIAVPLEATIPDITAGLWDRHDQ